MLLQWSKFIGQQFIVLFLLVLFFAMFPSQTMPRFNHVSGNVFTKITVRQVSIMMMKISVRFLLNHVKPMEFNRRAMFKQASFVIEHEQVSFV